MNVERILQLADIIEVQPHAPAEADAGFNMARYTHPCGTPACIAGWALAMKGEPIPGSQIKVFFDAMEWMGLTIEAADDLFVPGTLDTRENYTPSQAAKTLRHLAHTGEVKWEL